MIFDGAERSELRNLGFIVRAYPRRNRGGAAIPRIRRGGGQVRSLSLAQEDEKGSGAGRIGVECSLFGFQNGIVNSGREEKSR